MPSASAPAPLVGPGRWSLGVRHIAEPRFVNGRMGHVDVNSGRGARVSPTPCPAYGPMTDALPRQWQNGTAGCDFAPFWFRPTRDREVRACQWHDGARECQSWDRGRRANRDAALDTGKPPIGAWSHRPVEARWTRGGHLALPDAGRQLVGPGTPARRMRDASSSDAGCQLVGHGMPARRARDASSSGTGCDYGSSDASRVRSRSSRW